MNLDSVELLMKTVIKTAIGEILFHIKICFDLLLIICSAPRRAIIMRKYGYEYDYMCSLKKFISLSVRVRRLLDLLL